MTGDEHTTSAHPILGHGRVASHFGCAHILLDKISSGTTSRGLHWLPHHSDLVGQNTSVTHACKVSWWWWSLGLLSLGIALRQVSVVRLMFTFPRPVGIWLSAVSGRGHVPKLSNQHVQLSSNGTSARPPVTVVLISPLRYFASWNCRACPH